MGEGLVDSYNGGGAGRLLQWGRGWWILTMGEGLVDSHWYSKIVITNSTNMTVHAVSTYCMYVRLTKIHICACTYVRTYVCIG